MCVCVCVYVQGKQELQAPGLEGFSELRSFKRYVKKHLFKVF